MYASSKVKVVKKPTNVSLDIKLLEIARELNINLSATFNEALKEEIKRYQQQAWREKNRAALAMCNQLVDENGLFSDEYRDL